MNEQASGKAIASLVLGILAWVGACPCLGGLLAMVLGAGERSGVGRAGFLLGLLHLILIAAVAMLVLLFGAAGMLVQILD